MPLIACRLCTACADAWYELQPRPGATRDNHVSGYLRLVTNVTPLMAVGASTVAGAAPSATGAAAIAARKDADGRDSGGDDDGGGDGALASAGGATVRGSMGSWSQLPHEMAVCQQVTAAVDHLKGLYELSLQRAAQLQQELHAMRTGLRTLIGSPELAPFRARATRQCTLTVHALEVRGVGARRAAANSELRCVLQSREHAERTEVRRGVASPRWDALAMTFPVDSWADELTVTLVRWLRGLDPTTYHLASWLARPARPPLPPHRVPRPLARHSHPEVARSSPLSLSLHSSTPHTSGAAPCAVSTLAACVSACSI